MPIFLSASFSSVDASLLFPFLERFLSFNAPLFPFLGRLCSTIISLLICYFIDFKKTFSLYPSIRSKHFLSPFGKFSLSFFNFFYPMFKCFPNSSRSFKYLGFLLYFSNLLLISVKEFSPKNL